MRLVHNIAEFDRKRTPLASDWTAIVPAAGKGSRLNFSGPKLLYPVLDRPIINWLVDLLKPLCRKLVVVASPAGENPIRKMLLAFWAGADLVIQEKPTGMGDAIALCDGRITTPYCLVIWGDQITPRAQSLAACMTLLQSDSSILAVIPTMVRDSPYIHFKRDDSERIVAVYQARETDERMAQGESDCGVFCFRTEALFRILRQSRGEETHRGAITQENNFLSLLPMFQSEAGSLVSVRINDVSETMGINTAEDAEAVGQILKKRAHEKP